MADLCRHIRRVRGFLSGQIELQSRDALSGRSGIQSGRSRLRVVGRVDCLCLSKFLMGSVSDRSNARFFLPLGLVMSAAVSLTLGLTRWATSSIAIMFIMLFLNGWFQGM